MATNPAKCVSHRAELLEANSVILLPEASLDPDWKDIKHTTLHAVAHRTLEHTSPLLDPDLDHGTQERQANPLV